MKSTSPEQESDEFKDYPFLSWKGIELIKKYAKPRISIGMGIFASYKERGDSYWKIGYGSCLIGKRQVGAKDKLTREEIDAQLVEDLKVFSEYIKQYVFVRLNPNKRAALLSFAFSIGIQSFKTCRLLELINGLAGKKEILREWSPYINTIWLSGGQTMVDRRRTELNLYYAPEETMVAAAYHRCESKFCLINLAETWNGGPQQVKAIEYLEKKLNTFDPSGEVVRRFFRYWSEPPHVFGHPDNLN